MVIYVHPIENKVTIVRRDNKVTISHVGVQGERGPELMIQYSKDGVSGWHAVPTVDDDYLRFSSDEGRTWGSAVWFNTIDECHDYMIKSQAWAENPVDVEVEAGKYSSLHHRTYAEQAQFEAEQARDNAAASMNAAAASAGSASQSASNALSSANDAELSKQKAYQWAENPVDIEVEAGLYSAKHWAIKSQEYSVTAASDVPYDNAESGLDGANVQAALDEIATEYQTRAEKGLPNGYASLDSDGYLSEVAKQVQLSTPIIVSLTGEVLGSVQVDLSSNVSMVTSFSGPGFLLELDENGDLMPTDIPVEG